MKVLNQISIITLILACSAITFAAPAKAGEIRGSSGNNFTLAATSTPGVFTLTHPGVAHVSLMGNCKFDGDEIATAPALPGEPWLLSGTFRFASADGATTLNVEAEGTGRADPANPSFVNLHYALKFTGGTGEMANLRGKGELNGVAMFTSAAGGTTTFTFAGQISTHGSANN